MKHDIDMHEVSDEFAKCWQVAGRHLDSQNHRGELNWLKANLTPPFLEHLSFRLENPLFFIRIDDVDGNSNLIFFINNTSSKADRTPACQLVWIRQCD